MSPNRVKLLISKRWIVVGLLAGFFVLIMLVYEKEFSSKAKSKKNAEESIPSITCTSEDYRDTPFTTLVRNNATIEIPDAQTLEKLTREEMAALYHRYVENLQYFCKRIVRLGKVTDGGWDVCDDEPFRPKAPCIVYSFGINDDFSFDDAVIKEYGCEVHSFDPSMNVESHQRSKLNYFYKIGLWSTSHVSSAGWQMKDIDTIRGDLKHTERKIAMFKMDIELSEWDAIPSLVAEGILKDVNNFLIEVHLNLYPHSSESDRKDYLRALRNLKLIYDAGFRIFRTHRNPTNVFVSKCKMIDRANCHELHMVRVKT